MRTTQLNDNKSLLNLNVLDPRWKKAIHIQTPVFILGIMERCGSNFLAGALQIHSGFQLPNVLEEDYLLEHAHLLLEYVDKTYARWKGQSWIEDPEGFREALLRRIGDAIQGILMDRIGKEKRLLARTPGAFNIDKFFDFFPQAQLLVLIRDGRDVVESAACKWPSESYEFWMKQWADGARSILKFMQTFADRKGASWELVRYEDLVDLPQETFTGLLNFLGVESTAFDWSRLERLPVFGSSQCRDEKGNVTGKTVEKSAKFKFQGRWQNKWGWSRKRMFKKIAGKEMIALGYTSDNNW
jgi:hypothetical protein